MSGTRETSRRQAASIAVICPFYNEEEVAEIFYAELSDALGSCPGIEYQLIFVDDGSSDATLQKLLHLQELDTKITVLALSRNFGHQVALSAGLDHASADAVILMDSDLQHPPQLIPRMLAMWQAGSDIVSMVRTYGSETPVAKRISSSLFYKCLNRMSDTPVETGVADFCLLSRRAYQALRRMPERHRFLRGMVAWMGFERAYLHYVAPQRQAGTSKYTWTKMLRLALDAALSFSAFPIRIATRVGVAMCAGGALYFGYVLARFFFYHDSQPGWSSIISVALWLGGMQLLFLGVIGEYVARIFEEVKQRPLYLLKHRASSRNVEENAENALHHIASEDE